MPVSLISKQTFLNKAYNWRDFFNIGGAITHIYIATAYSDPQTIREIFNNVKNSFDCRGAIFAVFLDQNASRALRGQEYHQRYCKLEDRIKKYIKEHTQRKNTDECGIFLVDLQRLFHSKFILINSTTTSRLVIGSINMTTNGLGESGNEELIYVHDNPNSTVISNLYDYINFLSDHENSTSVHNAKNSRPKSSLRDFFLNGRLYIQFDKLRPFSFELELPKEIIEQRSLHPFIESRGASINILNFCKDFKPVVQSKENYNNNHIQRWKKFCIETSYGYWAPSEYIQIINEILNEKRERIGKLLKKQLTEIQTKKFNERAQNFFIEIENKITKLGFEWELNQIHWHKWLNRLHKKIFDANGIRDEFFDKLVSGVISSEMPDIWESTFHRESFLDSFLESLQFNIDSQNTRNYIAKSFKKNELRPETFDELAQMIRKVNFTQDQG